MRALPRAGPARQVNVALSGLLEKSFPGECWARRLADQARNLQRQRQPEAALARCHQALDLGKWARAQGRLPAHLLSRRPGTGELSGSGEAKSRSQVHPRAVFSRTCAALLNRLVRPRLLFHPILGV